MHSHPSRWRVLALIATAELLGMSLWFTASAVSGQLQDQWALSLSQVAFLTTIVQIGFVAGTAVAALLNLADLIPERPYFAVAAILAAGANAALTIAPGYSTALILRFLTGFLLAAVYPPAMKMAATWFQSSRGIAIGIVVGALTVGKATPYLVRVLESADSATVILAASGGALFAALLIGVWYREGPYPFERKPFAWSLAASVLRHRPTRLATAGYLGHMWELYAMWTWAPLFLIASYTAAGWSERAARVAGFGTIAIGAIGCVVAGSLADRMGRTTIAGGSLLISGACCLIVGYFFDRPAILTLICLVWGFAVVADSAQFSAAVSELTDARYVGTALTLQTSLGFLLTLLSIYIVPQLVERVGWNRVFIVLALGPAFGIWSMLRLRALPEATLMASGNR